MMDYEHIPVILKRFSFSSKMNVCQVHSSQLIDITQKTKPDELIKGILPQEIETFALFSIMTGKEYRDEQFNEKTKQTFFDIITAIRNYEHPALVKSISPNDFMKKFFIASGMTQMPSQENYISVLLRYNFIFNYIDDNINMKNEFCAKFSCSYSEFQNLSLAVFTLFNKTLLGTTNKKEVLDYIIFTKYLAASKHLIISYKELVERQTGYTPSIVDYLYGFKLFLQYPFIIHDETVYLPLPHILIQAATKSLLYRLTVDDVNNVRNDRLSEKIGKYVLENYVKQLLCENQIYDEIVSEFEYDKGQKRTIDIMIRKDDKCLFIDVKMMRPSIKLRTMDDFFIEKSVERIVEYVNQIYSHIKEKLYNEYYPFICKVNFIPENIFGIVVLFEDCFIMRDQIMKEVAKRRNIKIPSIEYDYICSNIKIMDLREIEKQVFNCVNLFDLLIDNKNNKTKWFDITYSVGNASGTPTKMFTDFRHKIASIMHDLSQELLQVGLVK